MKFRNTWCKDTFTSFGGMKSDFFHNNHYRLLKQVVHLLENFVDRHPFKITKRLN
jgi:Txe/YoeB family toxin of Txe-Axe toxin-antitoxin module